MYFQLTIPATGMASTSDRGLPENGMAGFTTF